MKIIKKLVLGIVTVSALCMPVSTVLAHGGNHKSVAVSNYSQCSFENCTETGIHSHDGITYCGHNGQESHSSHNSNHKNKTHHN